eukprot:CAMPEP_0115848624 /NCGR_PEP_ID=MMETSP0287-20121206/11021_1 /TAXON_ID=412157 /ORGANISM="Chrysochromulina rotalis, Strain UIO044" /LENGTH=64 /DNA_ID=CAMNT_0003302549 /DNA_START=825 /DNA_END=1016 /DNA_ORIENTATION=+
MDVEPSSGTTPTFWSTSARSACQDFISIAALSGNISVLWRGVDEVHSADASAPRRTSILLVEFR